MNCARISVAIVALLFVANRSTPDTAAFTLKTQIAGNDYEVAAMRSKIRVAPPWKVEQNYPPLGARKAIAAARTYLGRFTRDPNAWEVQRVSLRNAGEKDSWIYIIELMPPIPGGRLDGRVSLARLIVYMDGSAAEARLVVPDLINR